MKLFGSLSRLVSILFRKDSQDITVRPSQTTTYTASRDVQLPPGDANHVLVSADSTQALTNKTIDADLNTITNIENADIKAAAAIALSKLAATTANRALQSDGSGVITPSSVTSTELGYVSGVTSAIQTQLDAKASTTYVDSAIQGFAWKAPVRAASTADVDIATELENGDTLDGVTLSTGDRVLLKNQSDASENGIYNVSASGAASRSADANTTAEVNGLAVFVLEGTVNADRGYVQTEEVGTIDADNLSFVQFSSAGSYVQGTGITISGQTISTNDSQIVHDNLSGFVANEHVDHSTVQIATGSTSGLNGGGDITTTRNIVAAPERATSGTIASADEILFADVSNSNALRKTTAQDIADLAGASAGSFQADWVTGDGTTKVVSHSLGSKDIRVTIYDKTDDSTILVDSEVRTDANTLTLTSSEAPGASGWRVLVKLY